MDTKWIIEVENNAGHKMYIARVRPTKYTSEISNARRYDDEHVKRVCGWLIDIGVSFTVKQFTRV